MYRLLVVHGTEDRILPFETVSQRLPTLVKDARLVPVGSEPHTIA
jgi:non-heme chloroperoxidase